MVFHSETTCLRNRAFNSDQNIQIRGFLLASSVLLEYVIIEAHTGSRVRLRYSP